MSASEFAESLKALDKSAEAIENAKYNLKGGFITATTNRAYYACYYAMISLLYTQNVYAKTHQGARAKFSELFIKTSIFPIEMSDSIALLFDSRQEADYDLDENITKEEAASLITKAEDIYQLINAYFQRLISNTL
ncbi:MAG TPA: HEPN domain-containing protein [Puia sp.]|nr:HEPN domain-containing protein [Puia sp.]